MMIKESLICTDLDLWDTSPASIDGMGYDKAYYVESSNGRVCPYCGKLMKQSTYTVDHILPKSVLSEYIPSLASGMNVYNFPINKIIAHRRCNEHKQSTLYIPSGNKFLWLPRKWRIEYAKYFYAVFLFKSENNKPWFWCVNGVVSDVWTNFVNWLKSELEEFNNE